MSVWRLQSCSVSTHYLSFTSSWQMQQCLIPDRIEERQTRGHPMTTFQTEST